MNNKYNDIGDDEIRVLGGNGERSNPIPANHTPSPPPPSRVNPIKPVAIVAGVLCLLLLLYFLVLKPTHKVDLTSPEPSGLDALVPVSYQPLAQQPLSRAAETGYGFIEMADTVINDIPLRLYLPHQVRLSLCVGAVDRNDDGILFATQAADVRADNGGIVGAFVLKGEPLAWGQSKKGYCAIINDTVTVGVAENSPLFEEATEKEGYFFRQFPLVDQGKLVDNEPRGKAVRRALCDRSGEIFTAETLTDESFHDFSQALVDLGVDYAIYMVGGESYGWITDTEGQRHEFGNPAPPKKKWKNISYLVMRNKE